LPTRPQHTGALAFTCLGDPVPQGSKRWVGRLIESNQKTLEPWREALRSAAHKAMGEDWRPLDGPLVARITFRMRVPKSRPKWRKYPDGKPDLDKLVRAVFDACTSVGVWCDDAQVVDLRTTKNYGLPDDPWQTLRPGVTVDVASIELDQEPF
jgi:Holliday junction resolvase RusA-like endonuclease